MPQFNAPPSKDTSNIIRWINGADEEVPPYGVVEVESFDTETKVYTIRKPTDEGMIWFANRNVSVTPDDEGESYSWSHPQLCLLNEDLESSPGTGLSPCPDTWEMGAGNSFVLYTNDDEKPVGSNLGGVYPGGAGSINRHHGILLDNVPGSTAPLTNPSIGTVRVLAKNDSGNFEVTNICLETNYRLTVPDLEAGSFCKIEFLDGEWSFYVVDCEDSGLPTTGCT